MRPSEFIAKVQDYRNVMAAIHPDWDPRRGRAAQVGAPHFEEHDGVHYAEVPGTDFAPLHLRIDLARALRLLVVCGCERDTLYASED
jgi:hypothetical protein